MRPESTKANKLSIAGNLFLFVYKLFIGLFTNSIAVISDAMNSFMDTLTTIIVYFCMKVSAKHPDKSHPFGHYRAEPIAAMLIAVLTAIVGFQILQKSFFRIFEYQKLNIPLFIILIYFIIIIIKASLMLYTKHAAKRSKSEALRALWIDHRNDALVSLSVIIGFLLVKSGYYFMDSLIGFMVAGYIIKSGWDIGLHNIKYLMGETPSKEFIERIKKRAMLIKGVKALNSVRAHYVGLVLNVEIHIEIDRDIALREAHDIGEE